MEKKMEMVEWLNNHGYFFFGETLEHFANRFDLKTLEIVKKGFAEFKGIKED